MNEGKFDKKQEFQLCTKHDRIIQKTIYILSKQLLRSGTSIGANVAESEAAQSRADFKHKLSISAKEARETKYWLQLLEQSNITQIDVSNYLIEAESIIKILTAIVMTTNQK